MQSLKLVKAVVVFTFLVTLSGKSWADWYVRVEDDAFGGEQIVKLLGSLEDEAGIVYECKGGHLGINYLEKDTRSGAENAGSVAGDIAIRIDNHQPILLKDVRLYRHNLNYIAFRSYHQEKIKASLALLQTAKVKVVAGIKMPSGTNISRTGDFYYAAKSVNQFIRECGIKLDS